MMRRLKSLNTLNQEGMVAIVVTSVLMIVISLIVVGYSSTIRDEQRQALDNQLSTQAFYAAESGINLARNKIKAELKNNPTGSISKQECKGTGLGIDESADYKIDDATGSEITCLLVKDTTTEQIFQDVGSEAKGTWVRSDNPINNLVISWEGNSRDATSCTGGDALESSRACPQPILRVDIVPLKQSGMDQTYLQRGQFTVFLSPKNGGSITNTNYSRNSDKDASSSPSIVSSACNTTLDTTYLCAAKIINLPIVDAGFAVKMVSLYGSSDVAISSIDGSNNKLEIKGQYVIDSTAKAVDVARRVQVRYSGSSSNLITWALGSSPGTSDPNQVGVCKLYKISAGAVTDGCKTSTP